MTADATTTGRRATGLEGFSIPTPCASSRAPV
jgi:hypothetical protein